ncbi:MAG: hypothetical protein E7616_08090 [Ruminococcaceae bacterium]|nr:hypothetical protein [Oscillospiraceae bacterium]
MLFGKYGQFNTHSMVTIIHFAICLPLLALLFLPLTMLIGEFLLFPFRLLSEKKAKNRVPLGVVSFLINVVILLYLAYSSFDFFDPLLPFVASAFITPLAAAAWGGILFFKKERFRIIVGILISLLPGLTILSCYLKFRNLEDLFVYIMPCVWNALFYFGSAGIACGVRNVIKKKKGKDIGKV